MISDKKAFCPLCDKLLYDPETECPQVCDKHYMDDDVKSFFEKVTAAITTIIIEIDALTEGTEAFEAWKELK